MWRHFFAALRNYVFTVQLNAFRVVFVWILFNIVTKCYDENVLCCVWFFCVRMCVCVPVCVLCVCVFYKDPSSRLRAKKKERIVPKHPLNRSQLMSWIWTSEIRPTSTQILERPLRCCSIINYINSIIKLWTLNSSSQSIVCFSL